MLVEPDNPKLSRLLRSDQDDTTEDALVKTNQESQEVDSNVCFAAYQQRFS
jgi:hypothetical protein